MGKITSPTKRTYPENETIITLTNMRQIIVQTPDDITNEEIELMAQLLKDEHDHIQQHGKTNSARERASGS